MSTIISDSTPVAMMTAGQLREYLGISNHKAESAQESDTVPARRYVYGLGGIRNLFKVSQVTAIKYKNTVIREAVMQQGRKIVVDADKAMQLFKEWREGVK